MREADTQEGPIAAAMRRKLEAHFAPLLLNLVNESHLHAGHAGVNASGAAPGESHFRLTIEAAAFDGLSRLARQRLVMDVLREELAGPVHALAIRANAPKQD